MAEATETHLLSEVMLHDPVLQQDYLVKETNREFKPLAAIQPGAQIEFYVPPSQNLYLDLNSSRLKVTVQIVKGDGTPLGDAAATKTAPVNLFLHSLFKDMTVSLSNHVVSDPSSMYPYRAYVTTAVNYPEDVQKTRLISEGWHKDLAGAHIIEVDPKDNTGAVARKAAYATASPIVELIGRPHLDIFQQDKLIVPGVSLTLKLQPADNAFVLMCATDNQNPKVKIIDATLIIHTKQLSDKVETAHRQLVLESNYRYPIIKTETKHMAVPNGVQKMHFENLFSGPMPDRVIVGLVEDKEMSGDYKKNPFAFRNRGVKSIAMKRNGNEMVPSLGYSPNFATGECVKDYITFQEQLGFDTGDRCAHITPAEWKDGFTLYAFKLTDGPIGSGTYVPRSHGNTGSVTLDMEFEAATANDLKLIIVSERWAMLEIDQFNNPVIS